MNIRPKKKKSTGVYCVSRQLNSLFQLLNCKIMILLFHNYDIKKKKEKKKRKRWVNLVVPSKREGCSEVAVKGVGRCSFTILHNPQNNITKNNLTLYHKIQRTPNEQQQKTVEKMENSWWFQIPRHLRSCHW